MTEEEKTKSQIIKEMALEMGYPTTDIPITAPIDAVDLRGLPIDIHGKGEYEFRPELEEDMEKYEASQARWEHDKEMDRRMRNSDQLCYLKIVLDKSGEYGFCFKFSRSTFWFICSTHKIECSGPFPDAYVSCPVTGQTLLEPALDSEAEEQAKNRRK